MFYNPNIHHRHSIRLRKYDYSQNGLYFVTLCVQNGTCLLGKIINEEMMLNEYGKTVEKWCVELSHKFSDIILDTYVIIPNHLHAIIFNNGGGNVGADLRVCPILGEHIGSPLPMKRMMGEHAGSPLHAVVQWFKTMTTNEYIRGVKTLG